MTSRWANKEVIASGEVFEALHSGLSVGLIATPRGDLKTCQREEALSDVMKRNDKTYDFLPVVELKTDEEDRILGLFPAHKFFDDETLHGNIKNHFGPLSEEFLIGAGTSILDFLKDADAKPCRLVVSGPKITGLVSLSDLQKLPVRATLFALITGFEITMFEAIKEKLPETKAWMAHLNTNRKRKIKKEIQMSRRDDGHVNDLLFTQFCEKADIIVKSFRLSQSKTKLRGQLKVIQRLRDNLAHANEYAATREHAKSVCAVVRNLLELRDEIAHTNSLNFQA